MLDNEGFNLWADKYDKSVEVSDEDNKYPFAGYKNVLNSIYLRIHEIKSVKSILDIGFGTAVLTEKLYNDGYNITGIDFSERMLQIASEKMPDANLFQHDISMGFPEALSEKIFDCIVSTYAMHHIADEFKGIFIQSLLQHLNPNGIILIGDVAFSTKADLEKCKLNSGTDWDDDEEYFIMDELEKIINANIIFTPKSHCAGVFEITNH